MPGLAGPPERQDHVAGSALPCCLFGPCRNCITAIPTEVEHSGTSMSGTHTANHLFGRGRGKDIACGAVIREALSCETGDDPEMPDPPPVTMPNSPSPEPPERVKPRDNAMHGLRDARQPGLSASRQHGLPDQ